MHKSLTSTLLSTYTVLIYCSESKVIVTAGRSSHPAERWKWLASISCPEEQIRLLQKAEASSPSVICFLQSAEVGIFSDSLFEVKSSVIEVHYTHIYSTRPTRTHTRWTVHLCICDLSYSQKLMYLIKAVCSMYSTSKFWLGPPCTLFIRRIKHL